MIDLENDIEYSPERPSKSEYKRITAQVEKFVHGLLKLSPTQMDIVEIPDYVKEIVLDAKPMKATGSRKRHLKHAINYILNDERWSHPLAREQYDVVVKGNKGLKLPKDLFN